MVGNDVGWTGARLGRGVGATIGAAVWLSGVVVGTGIGFCVGGEDVGDCVGRAVGAADFSGVTIGDEVGDGVGRATGAAVGGDEHPQARLQASCASDESSPTTAQRDSGSSATHEQCFDGVPFLYHDELSTHVEDGTGAAGSVGVALGAAEGAALGSLEGMALEGEGVGAGVNDTANFIESAIEASSSHVSVST